MCSIISNVSTSQSCQKWWSVLTLCNKMTCFSLMVIMVCLVDVVLLCFLPSKWLIPVTITLHCLAMLCKLAKESRARMKGWRKSDFPLVCFVHFAAFQTLRILGNFESLIWFVDRGWLNGVSHCGLLRVWLTVVNCGKQYEFYHANAQLQYHNWKSSTVSA